MKKTKVLIPALGMLLLSMAASVTGTVAWFTANKNVSVTGMQVKAKPEDGIVINNDEFATTSWKEYTTATHSGTGVELLPTSTSEAVTWYHATSDDMNDHTAATDYETLTLTVDGTEVGATYETGGVGFVDLGETKDGKYDAATENAYYLLNNFYIKSADVALENQSLYINKVVATGSSDSPELDKALRVLVKVEDTTTFIYTPFNGTASYTVAGTTATTTQTYAATGVYNTMVGSEKSWTIPANTVTTKDACVNVAVYAYFEGEDENCKSINIKSTLDSLALEFQFGLKTVTAA